MTDIEEFISSNSVSQANICLLLTAATKVKLCSIAVATTPAPDHI